MDLAHEWAAGNPVENLIFVSILVLMDLAHEFGSPYTLSVDGTSVSILVLMDLAHESAT